VSINRAALLPGTVIVTATHDLGGWWIRLRSKLMRRPSLHNHVAMFTHFDREGIPRGLEGRPSGFGWANLSEYLTHPDTIANTDQPMTAEDRAYLVEAGQAMVGIAYDWAAILSFASNLGGIPFLPHEWPDTGVPSHVECASALDLLYEGRGLANPGGNRVTRATTPDQWTEFIAKKLWLV
jgi:hypothetical protein